jgi:hypothetical protein
MARAEPFLRVIYRINVGRRINSAALRARGRFFGDMRGFRDYFGWVRGKLGGATKPDADLRIWCICAVHDAIGPSVNHSGIDPGVVQVSVRKLKIMKTRFAHIVATLSIALLTFAEVSCTSSSAKQTTAQSPEQHVRLLRNAHTQELEYLKGLEKTIREEKRSEAWAAKKESELRSSFSGEKSLQNGALKSVDCRSSKCDLQFQVSPGERQTVAQQAAINRWIATSQPCGYTMTPWPNPERESGEIRVFLSCIEP